MSQDNIFREVDEELRRERMRGLWRRFGPYVIGAAIAVVLIVAVNEGWQWWQNSRSAEQSDRFYSALELAEGGDAAAAQAALDEIAGSGAGGYSTLARFKQAALLAKDGKTQEAVAGYDALANSESNPRLRELALVFAGNLLVEAGDLAAVQQRVGALTTDENPLRNAAREALGLAQYKAGALEEARTSFEAITDDPRATEELLGRVQLYLAQLEAQGIKSPEPVVEAGSTTSEPAADEPAAETSVDEEPAPEGTEAGAT